MKEASTTFFSVVVAAATETIILPDLNCSASIDWIICSVGEPEDATAEVTPERLT